MIVTYLITFVVKSGSEEEFLGLLKPVLDAMRHEHSFLNAVLHRDNEAPNRFMLYESWSDADDVARVQMHRDYRQPFWTRLPELLAEPRQVQSWVPMRSDFSGAMR
ncbi:antibiotic biosynthesis monooxygenase [Bosea sp. Root381]|uniref:putative quinol monooxygenase n=1 Tax=Bosea sp. Root381 TaxID=1736524 RepID=UPI0006F3AECB|nr:putative quinol monooxygenase [Bosea sp. Root381]KRE02160.1 antibiotic biosynthesis monooxygenase [Bosea sp. Root381]